MTERIASLRRKTGETDISMTLNLDGSGTSEIKTGIGFFDHMLNSFARHGFFDLKLDVDGDLDVDCHHTIEDTGIVLGEAIKKALGDKRGIRRFGSFILPMDDVLVLVAMDLSGRPYFCYDVALTTPKVGDFDTEMVREFFYAVSYSAGMNLHIKLLSGENNHHIIEGIFKAFAKALDEASSMDARIQDVLSTKGALYPTIHIKNGKCYNPAAGSDAKQNIFTSSPVKLAQIWEQAGASYIHIVDVDGAKMGFPAHDELIGEIVSKRYLFQFRLAAASVPLRTLTTC